MKKFYVKVVPPPQLVCVELNPGPRTRGPISEDKRMRIVALYQNARWPKNKIAKELDVTPETVTSVVAKYEETGSVKNRSGQGRKRILSSQEVKKAVKKAKSEKHRRRLLETSRKVVPARLKEALKKADFGGSLFNGEKKLLQLSKRSALALQRKW